ncbi:hypothetical protein ACJX0J_041632, partial [Zea mays]
GWSAEALPPVPESFFAIIRFILRRFSVMVYCPRPDFLALLLSARRRRRAPVSGEAGGRLGAGRHYIGVPLLDETLDEAKGSDAVLLDTIGDYKWDTNEKHLKPETGLLQLRAGLGVFANLRPAAVLPQASTSANPGVLEQMTRETILASTQKFIQPLPRKNSTKGWFPKESTLERPETTREQLMQESPGIMTR